MRPRCGNLQEGTPVPCPGEVTRQVVYYVQTDEDPTVTWYCDDHVRRAVLWHLKNPYVFDLQVISVVGGKAVVPYQRRSK